MMRLSVPWWVLVLVLLYLAGVSTGCIHWRVPPDQLWFWELFAARYGWPFCFKP